MLSRWVSPALKGWLTLVFVFLWLPIVIVGIYSFNADRYLLTWEGFDSQWYATALANREIRLAIWNSFVVAVGSSIVAMVLGGAAGIALARHSGLWTRPFVGLLALILVAPEIVVGIAYLIFFVRVGLNEGYARLIIGHSVFSSAIVTLIVRARLSGLDESLEEAAADLGATPLAALTQITLPLIRPALLAGGLLAFTFSLDDVVISSFVSTAGTTTLPVYLFSALRTGLKTEHAAIVTLTLGITLILLVGAWWLLRRIGESARDIAEMIAG